MKFLPSSSSSPVVCLSSTTLLILSLFFFFISTTTTITTLVSAGRLSSSHSIDMDELVAENRATRNNRRARPDTRERPGSSPASNQPQPEKQEQKQQQQANTDEQKKEDDDDDGIQMPQVLGRGGTGRVHSWRKKHENILKNKQKALDETKHRVNPMMAHMSTEQRAAHLLFSKVESKFVEQAGQARRLLQMLQDANPHHIIAKKWDNPDEKHPHVAAKELQEKEHYQKVQSIENIINRLDYQLNDIKSFAEEIAKDSASSRATHGQLTSDHEKQLDEEKSKCAELIAKQEERVAEVQADMNEKNKELTNIRNTLEALSGQEGSSQGAAWKLTMIQNADLIVIATGVSFVVSIVLVYMFAVRRGINKGLKMKRGGDDYLFDGRGAMSSNNDNTGAATRNNNNNSQQQAPPLPMRHTPPFATNTPSSSSSPNNAAPPPQRNTNNNNNQQQQQPMLNNNNNSSPGGELKNRALHRFDGGV